MVCPIVMNEGKRHRNRKTSLEMRADALSFAGYREQEAASLVKAATFTLADTVKLKVPKVSNKTYIGSGQLKSLKRRVVEMGDVDSVYFDCELSPSQTRTIEHEIKSVSERTIEVLDRFGLILAIFTRRARYA